MSATQVKNFDFDNETSKNIFLLSYINYMANERPQGEEQFHFKGALSDLRHFWQLKPFQNEKMLFISPQKLFSFSKYLSFCLGVLVMYQNGLIRKIRLISKFMTSPQPG